MARRLSGLANRPSPDTYTADGQRIVTRDPGTGRLTVTLRGLDTKVRRVVELQSDQWTWVKD